MQYSVDNLVRLAKRANNTIRPYLYVNPLQGKHIPTRPDDVMSMCRALAQTINTAYPDESLYVIGFAETATGIAAAISHFLNNVIYYQNTTREYQKDEDYIFFTESHSHATDQTLRAAKVGECLRAIDRIVFIDDEITTGNTIYKLIKAIKDRYSLADLNCSIVSILNSVTKERMDLLRKENIDFFYLSKLPYEYKIESILDIEYDKSRDVVVDIKSIATADELEFISHVNVRNVSEFKKYDEENRKFVDFVGKTMHKGHYADVLVLGTEEFMYPAFCLAQYLYDNNIAQEVRTHASTRSPIIVSGRDGYPLFSRYCIRSPYDSLRTTFVYNLRKYDKVIIVSDALRQNDELSDIIKAVKDVGNEDITIIRWTYNQQVKGKAYEK